MKIALIGQAAFGKAVLEAIVAAGKDEIVGVFAPPTREGRPADPIVDAANESGVPVFQFKRLRNQDAIDQFNAVEPELCVMAFVTDIVPMDMINGPSKGTIQYHPSLLPLHRGPSSINWPIVQGKTETGLTIFWPDDGLDTGPVLLQKTTPISSDDTLGSVYFQRLFPMGVEAMIESIDLVREGSAPRIVQDESKATYEGWFKAAEAAIDWTKPGSEIYNLIRGSDPSPGANSTLNGEKVSFYDASFTAREHDSQPGEVLAIDDSGIQIAVSGGSITAGRVRGPDRKKVPAAEFASAFNVEAGSSFGS